jgi:hypothetical protein
MKVFVVIVEDRHYDVRVHLFSDRDAAVAWAKEKAKDYCNHIEDYEEREVPGYEVVIGYSCEGDNIAVIGKELDEDK